MKGKNLKTIRFYQNYGLIGFNPETDKIEDSCFFENRSNYQEIFRNYSYRVFECQKSLKRVYLENYLRNPSENCIIF